MYKCPSIMNQIRIFVFKKKSIYKIWAKIAQVHKNTVFFLLL